MDHVNAEISGSTFKRNQAGTSGAGGAIYALGSTLRIHFSSFVANKANANVGGGALFVLQKSSIRSLVSIDGTVFRGCYPDIIDDAGAHVKLDNRTSGTHSSKYTRSTYSVGFSAQVNRFTCNGYMGQVCT